MADEIKPGDMFLWLKKAEVCIAVKKIDDEYDDELWQLFTLDLNRFEMEVGSVLLNPSFYERLA